MTEFLHQVVERRERNTSRPPFGSIYSELVTQMSEQYTSAMMHTLRAQESINRFMDTNPNPEVGMNLSMPYIDTAAINARLVTQHMTYMYTGNTREGFRGWVRIN